MGFLAWGAGLVNGVSQFGGAVWGGFTGSAERQRQQRDQQETQGIQDGQAKFAQSEARFKTQYAAAGFDPPMIQAQDNWQQLSHQEIWAKNQQLNNPPLASVAKAWHDLNDKLVQTADDYSKGLQQKIQAAWQGQAADAALNVSKPLSDWMTQSAAMFKSTGDQVSTVSDAADQVKNLVGQPKGFDLGQAFGNTLGRGPVGAVTGSNDVVQQMQQQHSEEQAARDAMARVYGPTYQQVDAQLPAFQDVHGNTVTPPPATPPPSGPLPPPVNSGGGGVHSGAIGGTAGGNLPGGGGSAAGGGSVSGGGSPSTDMGSGTQATTSAAAAAPTMGPNLGTPGAGGGAVGAGSGGAGAGGFAGAVGGLGGAAGGRAGMGAGGRTGSGSGTSGRAGSTGSSGTAGRGGASGSNGAMGGAGRGKRGGEDEEHERSTWLEEADDVWLNDMPSVAPPVFGASTERD